jgi:hypothetical protein
VLGSILTNSLSDSKDYQIQMNLKQAYPQSDVPRAEIIQGEERFVELFARKSNIDWTTRSLLVVLGSKVSPKDRDFYNTLRVAAVEKVSQPDQKKRQLVIYYGFDPTTDISEVCHGQIIELPIPSRDLPYYEIKVREWINRPRTGPVPYEVFTELDERSGDKNFLQAFPRGGVKYVLIKGEEDYQNRIGRPSELD